MTSPSPPDGLSRQQAQLLWDRAHDKRSTHEERLDDIKDWLAGMWPENIDEPATPIVDDFQKATGALGASWSYDCPSLVTVRTDDLDVVLNQHDYIEGTPAAAQYHAALARLRAALEQHDR